jgi:hypothetical protein
MEIWGMPSVRKNIKLRHAAWSDMKKKYFANCPDRDN